MNSPARNRPLWLNDGQPFAGTQTLRLHYTAGTPASLPEPLEIKAAGANISIVWSRVDDKTAQRVARVDLQTAIVPEANYAELRTALRRWRAAATLK